MTKDINKNKDQKFEKNKTNRSKQAQATKDKIFQVGIRLLRSKGFDGVNVQQIAKAAGVSVGTFYHHFDSKLDLFMNLYRGVDEYFESTVANGLKGHNCFDKIILFFYEYTKLPLQDGLELVQKIYIPENKLFLSQPRAMYQLLNTIIHEGQEAGEMSDELSFEEFSDTLFLLARGVIFDWALRDGSYDPQEKMRTVISLYLQPHIKG